ncbi:MAG: hypothetical protein K8U57_18410 [Planctomycetes bacterium]|nr:hypothetical protein [Planctomycetota bacterium]
MGSPFIRRAIINFLGIGVWWVASLFPIMFDFFVGEHAIRPPLDNIHQITSSLILECTHYTTHTRDSEKPPLPLTELDGNTVVEGTQHLAQ